MQTVLVNNFTRLKELKFLMKIWLKRALRRGLARTIPVFKHFPLQVFLGKLIYDREEEGNIALQPVRHIQRRLSPKVTQTI